MNKKNVVIIYGGVSAEHEISKISASNIISNIPDDKYNIIPVYITKQGHWLLYDGIADNIKYNRLERLGTPAILSPDRQHGGLLRIVGEKVKVIPVDVVFPVGHGKGGEDGCIQGLCEIAGIPYAGCCVAASAVGMDKALTKITAAALGIKQTKYCVFHIDEAPNDVFKTIRYKIGYPCFIKPANSGSSIGTAYVKNRKELETAVAVAFGFDRKVIAEKPVIGRELECAVIGSGINDIRISGIGEIIHERDFYDFEAKYADKQSRTVIPADIPEDIINKIRDISLNIFAALGGFGCARVDFFYDDKQNAVYFNEINTIPGFTSISMFQKLWEHEGLYMPELIDYLIESAMNRL